MAKSLTGELSIPFGDTETTLRPSFGALYEIEKRSRLPLPHLIAQLRTSPSPSQVLIILEEGARAGGDCLPDHLPDPLSFTPYALAFLERGIRMDGMDAQALEWAELFRIVTGILGRSEAEFWRMTLPALCLTSEGVAAKHGVPAPATNDELHALMQRFPDRHHAGSPR